MVYIMTVNDESFSGFSIISECLKIIPGTVQTCSNILKEGNILAIAPGGVYESQFSQQYNLMWKKRLGFAKVALDAKVVSFVPIFAFNLLLTHVISAYHTSVYRKFKRGISNYEFRT